MAEVIKCRAAVCWAKNEIKIEEIEVAPPKKNEVRIKVVASGLCHSDISGMKGKFNDQFPIILGHEGSGIVESIGEGVANVKPGDHVLFVLCPQCDECRVCKKGKNNICFSKTFGRKDMSDGTTRFSCRGQEIHHFMRAATFSQYTVVSVDNCVKINENAPLEKVCLLACGVPTGYGAVINSAKVEEGSTCAIFGLGAIGLSAVMGCRDSKASRIVAIDINSDKFELAKEYGATDCINPKDLDTPIEKYLQKEFDGGFDYTFECIGLIETMTQAWESTFLGHGECIIIGVDAKEKMLSISPFATLFGKKIRGSAFGGYKSEDLPKLVEKYIKGELNFDEMITHNLTLNDIKKAIELLESGKSIRSCSSPRWEPQISVLCEPGQQYLPQFLSEDGRWTSELSVKVPGVSCLRDKMDLLDYCKKVYPGRDITNIVESSHYQKIGGWCRQGATNLGKCKGAQRWIKPFRCLEGPFQSDALLVPEGCLFDHIHNASRCWPFVRWNQTGAAACQERNMQMRSFAMLLPCGISLFSGVEFVCCPKHFKVVPPKVKKTDLPILPPESEILPSLDDSEDNFSDDLDEDEDLDDQDEMVADEPLETLEEEEDEDEYDSDEDTPTLDSEFPNDAIPINDYVNLQTTSQTPDKPISEIPISVNDGQSTSIPTPDPYFTHFDPRIEHQSYKEAQQRLEEAHREKVTRVMKDWSDLEERYQDMRLADPKSAQSFKQKMTARFQVTSVQALEEEGNAEKHQLAAMHQQRVLAHINQRKREAMTCYTQALTELPPNGHRVEKCLQKLLRALHKDRAHALAHYRHLLSSGGTGGLEAAAQERPRTLERLIDIDRAVNQSMTMLKRYPSLSKKLSQLMEDYIQALRSKDDTPGLLLSMTEEAESGILDKYRIEIERKVNEKERQRVAEKQRKEQRSQEREKIREEKMRLQAKNAEKAYRAQQMKEKDQQQDHQEQETKTEAAQQSSKEQTSEAAIDVKETTVEYTEESVYLTSPTSLPTVDDAAVQRAVEEVAAAVAHQETEPQLSHARAHDFGHGEASFSVRREIYGGREGRNVYFTLAFAGVALMAAVFVGVAVAKYRASRSPHAQGFVEVDQTVAVPVTPEERHVANMQINGYENPTYKYFTE
ncbi:hypothetical protein PVAND_003810 [Polypedilum vanderplanki]|uniref:Uncharacterized protein n=1 Tax=Polypedilum vanderplanki TaxID=319348 RepID=A0A9J6BV61_POLVA|nr:hypothetical protein PVAND_003810 [Polypedilum vanderplanki]